MSLHHPRFAIGPHLARLVFGLTIFLLVAASGGTASAFQILVQVMKTKTTVPLEISTGDYVQDVKWRLVGPSGIPFDNQKLIFAGQDMQDPRLLTEYGVRSGSKLYLAERVASVGNSGGDVPVLVDGDEPGVQAIVAFTSPFGSQSSGAIAHATLGRVMGQAALSAGPGSAGSGATLSSMGGPDSPVGLWSTGGILALSGLATGASHDLVIGADIAPAPGSLIGAYVAHSGMELGLTDSSSRALGLYGGFGIGGNWTVAAQVGMAKARYSQADTSMQSLRHLAAVGLSGNFVTGGALLTTGVTLSGFSETIPGKIGPSVTFLPDRLHQTRAEFSLGATALRPLWQTGLVPFATLSAGSVVTRSDLTGRNRTAVADLTIGLSGQFAGGTATIALTGATSANLRATGLSAAYALRF